MGRYVVSELIKTTLLARSSKKIVSIVTQPLLRLLAYPNNHTSMTIKPLLKAHSSRIQRQQLTLKQDCRSFAVAQLIFPPVVNQTRLHNQEKQRAWRGYREEVRALHKVLV